MGQVDHLKEKPANLVLTNHQEVQSGPEDLMEKLRLQGHTKGQPEPLKHEEANLGLQDPRVKRLFCGTKT